MRFCALFIVQDPSPAWKQIINLLLFFFFFLFFYCVVTRTSGDFFSHSVHHLVSQTLTWGMVGLFAMLYMINSEAEVYNQFFQTGTQLIQQHGYPVTFTLLKEGRKGSPQPFMTQSHLSSKHSPSSTRMRHSRRWTELHFPRLTRKVLLRLWQRRTHAHLSHHCCCSHQSLSTFCTLRSWILINAATENSR